MFEDFHLPCFFSCPKVSDRYLIAALLLQQIAIALFGHKGLYRELPPMLQRTTHDEFIFVHIPADCCNAGDSKYNDAFYLVIQKCCPASFKTERCCTQNSNLSLIGCLLFSIPAAPVLRQLCWLRLT